MIPPHWCRRVTKKPLPPAKYALDKGLACDDYRPLPGPDGRADEHGVSLVSG